MCDTRTVCSQPLCLLENAKERYAGDHCCGDHRDGELCLLDHDWKRKGDARVVVVAVGMELEVEEEDRCSNDTATSQLSIITYVSAFS